MVVVSYRSAGELLRRMAALQAESALESLRDVALGVHVARRRLRWYIPQA